MRVQGGRGMECGEILGGFCRKRRREARERKKKEKEVRYLVAGEDIKDIGRKVVRTAEGRRIRRLWNRVIHWRSARQ